MGKIRAGGSTLSGRCPTKWEGMDLSGIFEFEVSCKPFQATAKLDIVGYNMSEFITSIFPLYLCHIHVVSPLYRHVEHDTELTRPLAAGAMLAASYLPWSAQEKLAVIITDAPCHGKDCDFCDFHQTYGDSKTA